MKRFACGRIWLAFIILLVATTPAHSADRSILKRADRIKPIQTGVHPGLIQGSLVVKFKDDLGIEVRSGHLYFGSGATVNSIERLILAGRVQSAETEFKFDKSILKSLRDQGQSRSQVNLADLSQYFRLKLPAGASVTEAARICDELNRSVDVELAYLEGQPEVAGDISPATPNFESIQEYLLAAPGGVAAYAAWSYPGGNGSGVTLCDIENGWNFTHEDLTKLPGNVIGQAGNGDQHGTAVMGELVGDSSISGFTGVGYGVTGICHGASVRMVSALYVSVAQAILIAAQNLTVGDIIIIELHQAGPHTPNPQQGQLGYVPMEWTPSVFDAIQLVTANGLIVCEAAGNGSENLNHADYGGWFDTTVQHSGAILCGAGAPPQDTSTDPLDRSRLSFSNYGWRVDLQGYGSKVVTTGYGGIVNPADSTVFNPGDPNQNYTGFFSGTSSATPIVTGSVACIQGRYKNVSGGHTMTAKEIRDLLYTTGSLQTGATSQNIGRRPNLGAAMLQVVGHSAYASPRTINVSLLQTPQLSDTVWLVNPHAGATSFGITIKDSLPILPVRTNFTQDDKSFLRAKWNSTLAASEWLTVTPLSGTVPPNDSVPIQLSFDGSLLFQSYFGTSFKARLDIALNGDLGIDTLPVPVMALSQDSIHGDTIIATTPSITHQLSSETNMTGWDYTDASAANWLFDGSLVASRSALGEKHAYRHIFGNGQRWRGRDEWQVDSSWMPSYLIYRDSTMSDDSIVGLRYEVWVPEAGDTTEFVLWRTSLFTRNIYVPNIRFGVVGDWDLPDSAGVRNLGGFDTTRQMIYQTGGPGMTQNAAGFALVRGKAYGARSGSNPVDVYPNGGFTDDGLYDRMATAGFKNTDTVNTVDRYSLLTAVFDGLLEPGEVIQSDIAVLSSKSGVSGLRAAWARARDLSDSLRYLSCPIVKTGDFNMDGALNSSDIILTVNFVFKNGPDPQPLELSADVNCSGSVSSSDIITLVNHVFKGGPPPCDACTLY